VGFNVAFWPMHHLGVNGMPRRIYTYGAETGWGPLNLLSTVGAVTIAVSVLLFIINAARSYRHGALAGNDPWGGPTLEWATTSPPPACNFVNIPVVHGRDPVWEKDLDPEMPRYVTGLAQHAREALLTTVVDALPDHRSAFPKPTIWPFLSAVATTILFIGSIFTPWAVVWGAVPVTIAVTFWFWPKKEETGEHLALEKRPSIP
jgi:cytochrome c oxidase subunit I+III